MCNKKLTKSTFCTILYGSNSKSSDRLSEVVERQLTMSMSLRMGHAQRIAQRISHRLSPTQKMAVKQTLLTLRLALIGRVHGGNYQPRAKCPKCDRTLTPLEIIQGFRSDPNDYRTECTSCHARFDPKLEWREGNSLSYVEIPFYCPTQVLAQLHGLEGKTPDEIRAEQPAIYHSVRVHHGNLRQAFAKIGVQYAYENVVNWQEKVNEFLGKLPDTVIAEVVDMSVRAVRSLRHSLGIAPFSQRKLAEEVS